MNKFIFYVVLIISFFSIFYCYFSVNNPYYSYLYVWCLFYTLILILKYIFNWNSISLNTVYCVSFLKFIVMPVSICYTDRYYNSILSIDEYDYYAVGIFLEIYATSMLLFALVGGLKFIKKIKVIKKSEIEKQIGSRFIYVVYGIIAFILYILIGRENNLVSLFIIKSNNNGHRVVENLSLFNMVVRQFIILSVNLLFITSIYNNYLKYKIKSSIKYLIFPLFMAVINIGLIVGERRSLQVYTALCCVVLLVFVFDKHKKTILSIIGFASSFVLVGMTIYKHFNAFVYGSYSEAIKKALSSGTDSSGWGLANTLQAYLYGPQSIAAALKFSSQYNFGLSQLTYDLARSTIGISFFVKNKGILLSQLYNHFLFNDPYTDTGHIIPNSVYGYIFFGIILSPLIIMVQGILMVILEYYYFKTKIIELKFIFLFILFRCAIDIYSNFPQTLSVASLTIISYSIVLLITILLKKILPHKYLKI